MANKFIVQGNTLILGDVAVHIELEDDSIKDAVVGGGYWLIDKDRDILYLYGKSIWYGRVDFDLLKAVKLLGNSKESVDMLEWRWSYCDDIRDVLERGVVVE